jgi:hypothetical protein
LLELYLRRDQKPDMLADRSWPSIRASHRAALGKLVRYYGRELVVFPLLAGPFFWKVLLGNLLSELMRDLFLAATIYCGHVGVTDYPHGTHADGRAGIGCRSSRPAISKYRTWSRSSVAD